MSLRYRRHRQRRRQRTENVHPAVQPMYAPAAWSPSGFGPIIEDIVPPRRWFVEPERPESEETLARRRQVQVMLMERLFGAAGWAALTPCQRRLVDLLMLELVPGRNGWRTGYSHCVRLLIGGPPGWKQRPLIFWVNGGRLPRGWGHTVLSDSRGSIAVRAGYVRPDALGVFIIGAGAGLRGEIDLETMMLMANWESGLERLSMTRIRALRRYAFVSAWAQHFAYCADTPPAGNGDAREEADTKRLLQRSAALGITMADLASILRVSPTFVCMLKHGRRRWRPEFPRRILTFLNAAEAAVVGTIDGPWQPLENPPRYPRARSCE
ncbi:MAG: hypothetical protein ABR915_25720 [Thermoguttaceae bacterium]